MNFKTEKNLRKKRKNLEDMKKYLPAAIGTILIVALILYNYYIENYQNYNYIKKDKSQSLVYMKYNNNSEKYPIQVPYINIDSEQIDAVNDEIDRLIQSYVQKEKNVITYEYDINGIILSLVIKMINNNTGYAPTISFKTYNINLDRQIIVLDQDLLELYQVNTQDVEEKIKETFEAHYLNEVEQGYLIPQECDYTCFLEYREVENYLENVQYFVKKGQLIAYKPFIAHSIYGEENYFTEDDFEFLIAKEAPGES